MPSEPGVSEAVWVDKLRRQDGDAYRLLLDRFTSSLYRFFLFSHGDRERARDQVAETYARFVPSVLRMRDSTSLASFLFGIARNVLREGWRDPWRQAKCASVEDFDLIAPESAGASPVSELMARESLDRAWSAMQRFEPPVRQILCLRYIEGLSVKDVASAMGMKESTVKSHLHRARRRLRGAVEEG